MKTTRATGRRLTPRQAAKTLAQQAKQQIPPKRFVGKVSNVANRETTGAVTCTGPISEYSITVQVRMNVDLAADDYIWIKEDQGAQGTYVFDGFVKGGGTGNNDADAPIPWTQSPGLTSPNGSDLTVAADAGQTTNIGGSGDTVEIIGDISGVELNDLDDVNAGSPNDNDALVWDNDTSKWINWDGNLMAGQKVKNASGAAVVRGDVGYIDEAGEYKETTTAYSDVAWCVVLIDGANNADIYVARRGRVLVALNGNCSAGDYLYTSTTAGQAQPQSYTRPELFAVALTANAAGAGGTCEALLLCNSRYVNKQSGTDIFSVAAASTSDFVATIATLPGGAVLTYNAPGSGAENTIDPAAANQYGKLRLYNSTRGTYGLIDDVVVGTNTITLTANVDGGWQVGDTITCRSQTCVYGAPPPYFYDIDLSAADNTLIPVLARSLEMDISVLDTGAILMYAFFHLWDTYSTPKVQAVSFNVAGTYNMRSVTIPLFQRRFCTWWVASGAGTFHLYCRIKGYWLATT